MELEPRDRLRDCVIGDMGGDSVGVVGGEIEAGDDRKGNVFAEEDSSACLKGDPS